MVSSSTSRSRSGRRSPSRKEEESEDAKAKETPEATEPAAEPATDDRNNKKKGAEWQQDKKQAAWSEDPSHPARGRSTGGGAVRNRRTAGTPGTFECPECYRVIQDNKTARDQHWESRYCRAARLYNRGYGTKEQCLDLADYEIKRAWQKWSASQGVNLRERPNEPKGLPPQKNPPSGHGDWKQGRRQSERERGRSHAGSYSRRKDDGREEYVKVTVKKEFHKAAPEGNKKPTKDSNQKAKGRNEKGKEAAESSEYSYTYEESSASEQCRSPSKKKVSAGTKSPDKRPAVKTTAATAAKAKDTGPADGQHGSTSSGGADQRRLATFNSLLRTAMETANSCGF